MRLSDNRVRCVCGRTYRADRVCCPTCGKNRPMKFIERPVLEIPDVERPACEYAERRGWIAEKVVSASRKSWPDRFFARRGVIRLVEFKRPGEEPNPQQAKRHRELRNAGVDVRVYDNLEAFKKDFE